MPTTTKKAALNDLATTGFIDAYVHAEKENIFSEMLRATWIDVWGRHNLDDYLGI